MNICQLLLLYLLLINGMFNSERVDSVNKKLQKSFVEIFGEGWDEEERREEIGKMARDWQNDDKQIEKNDQRETMTAIGDQTQQETSPLSGKTDQNDHKKRKRNDQLSEIQKREIIRKWHAIKERIKQRKGKQPTKEWYKMEILLAKKLGRSRTTIYKWRKELGMKGQNVFTDEQKRAIVWAFKAMKEKMKQQKGGRKYSREQWHKIEHLLARKLGPNNRSTIYKWIKKFGMYQFGEELGMEMKKELNVFTDEQKRAIVGAFNAIKERVKQRKCKPFSRKEWNEIETFLAIKLGTNRDNIYKWTRQFGMGQKKMRTDEEKLAIVEQFCGMERKNPKMSARKIAKALKVSRKSISKWKCQFGMR